MNKKNSKKEATTKAAPQAANPFISKSRFGGAKSPIQTKSQYKPTPIRITQHKG